MRDYLSLAIIVIVVTTPTTVRGADKPTRQQIVELSEKCKQGRIRLSLVAELGSDFSGLDLSGVDFRGYYCAGFDPDIHNANFSHCDLRNAEFGSAAARSPGPTPKPATRPQLLDT